MPQGIPPSPAQRKAASAPSCGSSRDTNFLYGEPGQRTRAMSELHATTAATTPVFREHQLCTIFSSFSQRSLNFRADRPNNRARGSSGYELRTIEVSAYVRRKVFKGCANCCFLGRPFAGHVVTQDSLDKGRPSRLISRACWGRSASIDRKTSRVLDRGRVSRRQ